MDRSNMPDVVELARQRLANGRHVADADIHGLIREVDRLRSSNPRSPPDPDGFAPGSMGCHEALHMAMVLGEMVGERLCEHPAVQANPAWAATAEQARQLLFTLYQDIGEAHL